MAEEKFLTVRDASLILGISEKEVVDLVESNQLVAYKVGGVYLRFKKQHLEEFKKSLKPALNKTKVLLKYSFKDRVSDFFYFNDFYILSILIILLILVIIFQW
jgi:excisionase family DNA binding protein